MKQEAFEQKMNDKIFWGCLSTAVIVLVIMVLLMALFGVYKISRGHWECQKYETEILPYYTIKASCFCFCEDIFQYEEFGEYKTYEEASMSMYESSWLGCTPTEVILKGVKEFPTDKCKEGAWRWVK